LAYRDDLLATRYPGAELHGTLLELRLRTSLWVDDGVRMPRRQQAGVEWRTEGAERPPPHRQRLRQDTVEDPPHVQDLGRTGVERHRPGLAVRLEAPFQHQGVRT